MMARMLAARSGQAALRSQRATISSQLCALRPRRPCAGPAAAATSSAISADRRHAGRVCRFSTCLPRQLPGRTHGRTLGGLQPKAGARLSSVLRSSIANKAEGASFEQLGLSTALSRHLPSLGIDQPTEIQAACIPDILAGKDVLGQAETGSGKTAAYILPLLERTDPGQIATQVLVILPTRELSTQVLNAARSFCSPIPNVKMTSITGGTPAKAQAASLATPPHLLIGTPGRILDHLRRGNLDLSTVRSLVVDEADRLYDMNFGEQLEDIMRELPSSIQTVLFSATLPSSIETLTSTLREGHSCYRQERAAVPETVKHYALRVADGAVDKRLCGLLRRLLEGYGKGGAAGSPGGIIFCNTREQTDELADMLYRRGLEVVTLHGGMEQWERNLAMVKLRLGTLHVLVATDVAARGLDVEHLAFVVHWDLPRDLDTFTHRCGRTGRAGRAGASYILAGPRQAQSLEGWANGEGDEQGHQGTLPDIEWLEADWVPQGFGGDDPFSEVPAPMWRLLIILGGKKDKLSKGDVLGGITGETGFKGKDVGSIEITDTQTYVAVSCDKAEAIWRQLDNARIKKKRRRVHRTWR